MNPIKVGARRFNISVATTNTFEESYIIQQWCIEHLGDRWAVVPPDNESYYWFFTDECDATLFRLRWL